MKGCELSTFLLVQDFFIPYKKKKMKYGAEFFNFLPVEEFSSQLLGTTLRQLTFG